MATDDRVVELVLNQTQARLEQTFNDFDAIDAKALGVLGADAATLGVIVAAHTSLNHLWWLPSGALALAAALLLLSVRPQEYDQGPDTRQSFERFGGLDYVAAGLQMLGELLAAVERNERVVIPRKTRLFTRGFVVFVVGLIGALLVGIFR
jgi:hypothetical protein